MRLFVPKSPHLSCLDNSQACFTDCTRGLVSWYGRIKKEVLFGVYLLHEGQETLWGVRVASLGRENWLEGGTDLKSLLCDAPSQHFPLKILRVLSPAPEAS